MKKTLKEVSATPPSKELFVRDLSNWKALERFVKDVEKAVRASPEYRRYITYLISEVQIKRCAFFEKIEVGGDVSVEFHHHPLTLFTIAMAVTLRLKERRGSEISVFEAANEVTLLHYQGRVGIVPLTKTLHELVHSGNLFVPASKVYGDVQSFVDEYRQFIGKDVCKQYDEYVRMSAENSEVSVDGSPLEIVARTIKMLPAVSDGRAGALTAPQPNDEDEEEG